MNKLLIAPIVAVMLQIAPSPSHGQSFSENFEVDPTAGWTVNKDPITTDETHNFFFDYSTIGVPLAPNSSSSSTRGLKLQANQFSGIYGGVSVSPTGQSFTGDYILTFDWWSSFDGPAPEGVVGSTQLSTFGIGTSGTLAQWAAGTQDSIWFAATGDGHSQNDWRAYSPTAPSRYADESGVYAAGSGIDASNADHPYYAGFGSVSPPLAQFDLYPQQTGVTIPGSSAFEWHRVEIAKNGAYVTWKVDDLLIATVPAAHDTENTGNNIFFGHSDINSTSAGLSNSQMTFTLIDNVQVVAIPEPGTAGMVLFGLLFLAQRRRANERG